MGPEFGWPVDTEGESLLDQRPGLSEVAFLVRSSQEVRIIPRSLWEPRGEIANAACQTGTTTLVSLPLPPHIPRGSVAVTLLGAAWPWVFIISWLSADVLSNHRSGGCGETSATILPERWPSRGSIRTTESVEWIQLLASSGPSTSPFSLRPSSTRSIRFSSSATPAFLDSLKLKTFTMGNEAP